jgi:hypothetical protein
MGSLVGGPCPSGRTIEPIGKRSNGPGKNPPPLHTASVASLGLSGPREGLTAEPKGRPSRRLE